MLYIIFFYPKIQHIFTLSIIIDKFKKLVYRQDGKKRRKNSIDLRRFDMQLRHNFTITLLIRDYFLKEGQILFKLFMYIIF